MCCGRADCTHGKLYAVTLLDALLELRRVDGDPIQVVSNEVFTRLVKLLPHISRNLFLWTEPECADSFSLTSMTIVEGKATPHL